MTSFEMLHGINIGGEQSFLRDSVFMDLCKPRDTPTALGEPTRSEFFGPWLDGMKVLQEAQTCRKKYISSEQCRELDRELESDDGTVPKLVARTAARLLSFSSNSWDRQDLEKYDIVKGQQYIETLLMQWADRETGCDAYRKALRKIRIRSTSARLAKQNPMNGSDMILLWEVLASEAIGLLLQRLRPISTAALRPAAHPSHPTLPLNEIPSPQLLTASPLRRLNVPRDEAFERAGLFTVNPDRKCIGPIVSILNFRGVHGVPPNMIEIQEDGETELPSYVREKIESVQVVGKDGSKASLNRVLQFPLDVDDGKVLLKVSPTRYSTKLAMRSAKPRVLDDLMHGRLQLPGDVFDCERNDPVLPCHLHCDGVVLTGDGKVVLAQRGHDVDIDAMQWAASFGESIDWDADKDTSGRVHPLQTIHRGLEEELGLPKTWLEQRTGHPTKVTFLDAGFQVDSLIYILFAMVELPQLGIEEVLVRARNYRTDNEPRAFSFMDFAPEPCALAIEKGKVGGETMNYAGRFGLMLASLAKFGHTSGLPSVTE